MKDINLVFGKRQPRLWIGHAGEHLATRLCVDCSKVLYAYPEARFSLLFQRPGEAPYIAMSGSAADADCIVAYPLTQVETGIAGEVQAELQARRGDMLIKSCAFLFCVEPSLGQASEHAPEPAMDWVDAVTGAATQARDAAASAEHFADDAQAAATASQSDRLATSADRLAVQDMAQQYAPQEQQRQQAETSRAQAEDGRQGAEAQRAAMEQDRRQAEQGRVQAEQLRTQGEGLRGDAERQRMADELDRRQAEPQRINGEAARTQAESLRQADEQARAHAEARRQEAELTRRATDTQREEQDAEWARAEAMRIEAETGRSTSEQARADAELVRVTAEGSRSAAEEGRSTLYATLLEAYESGGLAGEPGSDAVIFTPTVSPEGVVSWSNDGALPNPDPVNLSIHPRGDYSDTALYTALDLVAYAGESYIALKTSQGKALAEAAYWQKIAARGSDGSGTVDAAAAGGWAYLSGGYQVSPKVRPGSLIRVMAQGAATGFTHAGDSYTASPGIWTEVVAVSGDNTIAAGEGMVLAQTSPDSADMLPYLAAEGVAEGSIATAHPVPGTPMRLCALAPDMQEGEGTPSPDNIRAFVPMQQAQVARCGTNFAPPNREAGKKAGITYAPNPDGTTAFSGTATSAGFVLNILGGAQGTQEVLPGFGGKTITLSGGTEHVYFQITYYNGKTWTTQNVRGGSNTFAIPEGSIITRMNYGASANTALTGEEMAYGQLEVGDRATPYEIHSGGPYALTFPAPLYGIPGARDALCNDGTAVRRTGLLTLDGTEPWSASGTTIEGKHRMMLGEIPENIATPGSVLRLANLRCTHYDTVTAGSTGTHGGMQGICAGTNGRIYIYDEAYCGGDATEWCAYLAEQAAAGTPVQALFELAQPTTEEGATGAVVIPALPGANQCYSDSGAVRVEYQEHPAYTKRGLEARLEALEKAMA